MGNGKNWEGLGEEENTVVKSQWDEKEMASKIQFLKEKHLVLFEILYSALDISMELAAKTQNTSELSWICRGRFPRTFQRKIDPYEYLIELFLPYVARHRN